MCSKFVNKHKCIIDMMKSFHHRAFYCYLGMTVWIFFLIAGMYKFMSVGDHREVVKTAVQKEYFLRSDAKFRKIYMRACNPADSIIRESEGLVDSDSWLLQGVLVVTRHGDRGPLTHLRGGDKLPCDAVPVSPLLKSYEQFVRNASKTGRAWWVGAPGPFHNFPSLPPRATGTSCALGQLTPKGLLQMITVGNILREAYGDQLGFNDPDMPEKKDTGDVVMYSTRYRRTFQSLVGVAWGARRGAGGAGAARARESPAVAFCFAHCACRHHHLLNRKIKSQAKNRLESHPAIKDLVIKLTKVLFESQEHPDADVVRDAVLAYMCHDVPLPCSNDNKPKPKLSLQKRHRKLLANSRGLLDVDIDTLNMELDYINNQMDFNNDAAKKTADNPRYDEKKQPLDFDAQMEREKLLYYQQRYMDNAEAYDDVVVVKKNLDADFNFPNDARMDANLYEDYKEPTPDTSDNFCVRKEHIMSLFAYLEWTYRQEIKNTNTRKRGLLVAYGLIHNIVQNMIRIISENKPKFVLYSGHDTTLQALILALGLNNHQHYNIQYASRMIFEVYRRKYLRDEFKFTKRKAVALDYYFRVVYNGQDVTNMLSFCRKRKNIAMEVVHPIDDMKVYKTYLCSIENIVRFIHDDYFASFNASNYKDACATYTENGKKAY